MKLRIYDGNSVLTSNYYGSAPKRNDNETDDEYYKRFLQTSNGIFTNGIIVTLKNMLSEIIRERPDYIAVVFDKTRNTFRKEMFSDYKGTRGETPKPLNQQIKNMQNILKEIGIPVFISDKYEADDLACSITHQFKDIPNMHIDIVTKDHDYYQLVDNNITIWQPQTYDKTNKWYEAHGYNSEERKKMPTNMVPINIDNVFEEMGIEPYQVPDLKGLIGDTSDNIPGVKGISSAAAPLLCLFQTIEGIYEALEQDEELFLATCKALGIKRSPINALKKGKESAYLSKKLATMVDTNIDSEIIKYLPADINELALNINKEGLEKIIVEYELKSLIPYLKALNDFNIGNKETKNVLNLAVISDNEDNLDNLYMITRKLTSKRSCKIFCNHQIGSLQIYSYNKENFIKMSGDKAILFVVHDVLRKKDFEEIVTFAKTNGCQLRIAVIKEDKIKLFSPTDIKAAS